MREGDPINTVAPANRPNTQDDNTRFTAVNNASNGNAATVVVGHNRSGLGPIAGSPQTAGRPLEDWQDNSADHLHKRKRTPDPTTGSQQHPNPYPQHHIEQNPQAPRQQQAQPQTTGIESGAVIEETMTPKHHSMEVSYSEQGKTGGESNHNDLRELRMVDGSPQTPGIEGSELKRRKRQFANRTKTGCITCRRRKKKCDEGKPECTNCRRGGFVCEGYTNKIAWPKVPAKTTQPVSIQSRDVNPSASTSPSPGTVPSVMSTPVHLRLTGDQHSASTISPQQGPGNIDTSHATSTPPPGGQFPPARQTPVPQQQPQVTLPRTPTFVTSGPLMPSPTAASPVPSGAYENGEMTEKQKMLSGKWYYGSAPELMAERERCKQACYRFNNALMLNASKAEQWRLFVETLRPGGQYEDMPGGVVNKVDVETPFHCSYGTNISLGEEVRIGPGCSIIDAAPVTIKARTILDGDVKIYTTIRRQDPRKRMGAKGPELAKPVIIEEDCWIGGNVTVLPGVTISKGAVIGAGSIVCKDVPPYTVAAGNPAAVLSGVYNNGAGM